MYTRSPRHSEVMNPMRPPCISRVIRQNQKFSGFLINVCVLQLTISMFSVAI